MKIVMKIVRRIWNWEMKNILWQTIRVQLQNLRLQRVFLQIRKLLTRPQQRRLKKRGLKSAGKLSCLCKR